MQISHKLFDSQVLPISVCVNSGTLQIDHNGLSEARKEKISHKLFDCRVLPISVGGLLGGRITGGGIPGWGDYWVDSAY